MQKVAVIILVIIVSNSCSVERIRRSAEIQKSAQITKENVADIVKEQNITKGSFIIQKADIEIFGRDGSDKMMANIKFNNENEYLISLRGKTGIEAARIYLSVDTILANDRINRKIVCSSPEYFKTRYGVSLSFLPLLIGDYIGDKLKNNSEEDCVDGFLYTDCINEGVKIRYTVDCNKEKIISAIVESSKDAAIIHFKYNEFFKYRGKWIPGKIELKDSLRDIKIIMEIKKISVPWDGEIEFIPGNRYEINRLI